MADLILVSQKTDFTDLEFVLDGQIIIDLKQVTASVVLNNTFTEFVDETPINFDNTLFVYINGMLQNFNIGLKSFTITDIINERIDTCNFVFRNQGDNANNILVNNVIHVFDKDNNKLFAGTITRLSPEQEWEGGNYIEFKANAVSWEFFLNSKKVVNEFQNLLAGDIIKEIINTLNPFFTTNNVEDGVIIESIVFNYLTIGECIKKLSKIIGYNWYVDYNKDIHFFPGNNRFAPVIIEDGGQFENLKFLEDNSQIRNSIILEAGSTLDFFDEDERVADGVQTTFNLAYEPFSPVSVFVDSGSGFVAKTLGIQNEDTTGFDFLLNASEKTIINLDEPLLSNTDILRATYNRQIPVISLGEDSASIEKFKAQGVGDGRFEFTIRDSSITDFNTANDRVEAELLQYADTRISGSFVTNNFGFQSGQLLTINSVNFGISTTVLIQSVSIKPLANFDANNFGLIKYTVKFTTLIKGLQEFLLALYDGVNAIELAQGAVVNTYFSFRDDSIQLEEEEFTATLGGLTFTWNNFAWDEALWS